jgi:hypothetical protein
MDNSFAEHYLKDALFSFRSYKKLAEKALSQIGDDEFFVALDDEANSIAVIVKHITGNMFSRWTDFLTTDGEKPDRQRDMEFVITPETTRDNLMARWEQGWQCMFDALEPLKPEDFSTKVLIRGEEHSIIEAINRQLTHYASHIGQIIFLAKHFRSSEWKSLSIPRNRSAEFNVYLTEKAQQTGNVKQDRFDAPQDFVQESKG